jgi:galactose mutarotase-like enzyme
MFRQGEIRGHAAVWLENELLRLAVLPRKGADIVQFVHKPTGVDCLMATPAGLQPPGREPPADFLDNYPGAWQELFPNTGQACQVEGADQPFHGEVALLPWTYAVEQDDETATAVRFAVDCRRAPFRLERLMRLRAGSPVLEIEGTVSNEGAGPAAFVWGHHLVLGGDFLEEGCRLEVPATTIETPAEPFEPARARLAPGQQEAWPHARGRQPGTWFDLRRIPGPEAASHDDAFLTGFSRGELAVTNPRLGLRFTLQWQAELFRTLVLWQPYGGPQQPPLTGAYGLGIEPWVYAGNLARAMERGAAVVLGGGERLTTGLQAGIGPAES